MHGILQSARDTIDKTTAVILVTLLFRSYVHVNMFFTFFEN